MGYNTTVLILNDGFGQLERDPAEFVAGILHKMHDGGDIPVGNHANPAYVMPTQHADVFRLYGTHGNLILELSPYSRKTMELAQRDAHGKEIIEGYIKQAQWLLTRLKKELKELS